MRILLIGEYSRLHNSLKEGLKTLGHEVTLVGNGDRFKKFPVDINIDSIYLNKYIPVLIRKLFFKLFKIDILDYEVAYNFKKTLPQLKGYDIVQLINENALNINPKTQIRLLNTLLSQNKKLFLLSCGEDYINISYYLKNKNKYSILTPYLDNNNLKKQYQYSLKYLSQPYKDLHYYIMQNCIGVIATDLDYHMPYFENEKYLGLIPYPINIDKIEYQPIQSLDRIKIFHGINTSSSIKKGNDYFSQSLNIIKEKYGAKVEIITTYNLPYKNYSNHYNECHILLDQVFSYDQGYNALEAMAKGKVVFTGAEIEWLDYYNLEEDTIAINALPDINSIVQKLEWLIINPEKIIEISKNARAFIEKEHNYKTIAKTYQNVWRSKI